MILLPSNQLVILGVNEIGNGWKFVGLYNPMSMIVWLGFWQPRAKEKSLCFFSKIAKQCSKTSIKLWENNGKELLNLKLATKWVIFFFSLFCLWYICFWFNGLIWKQELALLTSVIEVTARRNVGKKTKT